MKIINDSKIPIWAWCSTLEEKTIQETRVLADLDFVVEHIALMADAHPGGKTPVGIVLVTDGVIVPNLIGNDIGCGIAALETNLDHKEFSDKEIKKIFGKVRKYVPIDYNKKPNEKAWNELGDFDYIPASTFKKFKRQLGTLGGGNHFIELQKDDSDKIWIVVHSGSRNLGAIIMRHFDKLEHRDCLKIKKKTSQGEFNYICFHKDSEPGILYKKCSDFAIEYAKKNRKIISDKIADNFSEAYPIEIKKFIDKKHNYFISNFSYKDRTGLVLHRKGVMGLNKDEYGIVPGSMGSPSYIVQGLGNEDSYFSCSHGAGRKLSRGEARKLLKLDEENSSLNDIGALFSIRGKGLEEAPGAYKNIDKVIEDQKELIKVYKKLFPIATIKGD